jgi:hypothetical protein
LTEHLLRLAVQRTGPIRSEELMGKPYRVFPAILVREKVLRNNIGVTFLPADEIRPTADAWNNVPVVERHPTKSGQPISARHPDILNTTGVGVLFNARFEDSALKADVYLAEDRIAVLPDTAAYVSNTEAGTTGELSTGFACQVEKAPGEFNGEKYDVVLRDLRPDHLALLPDEKGACSVKDGCGLGVNHAGACDCGCSDKEPTRGKLAKMVEQVLAIAKRVLPAKAENESDDDRRRALQEALTAAYGGMGKSLWVDSVFSDETTVVFYVESQAGESGLFRTTYSVADGGAFSFSDPEPVRRVTQFVPATNSHEVTVMNREQMIAHLAKQGPLDAETYGKLTNAQLTVLCAVPAAASPPPAPAQNGDPEDIAILRENLREERKKREALEASTRTALQAERRERLNLIEELIHDGHTDFSDQQIENMEIGTLRQLHNTVFRRAANYSGRGGPRDGGADFSWAHMGIVDGPAGSAALDKKVS